MDFEFTSYGLSDLGLSRRRNEDAWAQLKTLNLYVLADGMGGHKGGDVAASQAIHHMCCQARETLKEKLDVALNTEEVKNTLIDFIQKANARVYEMAQEDPSLKGMGTTLLALLFWRGHYIFAHVGDSRLYRMRKEGLDQISSDHSLLRELKDSGILLHKKEIKRARSILTRAVGTLPKVATSCEIGELQEGDVFLLCSDGLSDVLEREEIEHVLQRAKTLEEAAEKLIHRAKKAGGKDNITALIIYTEKAYAQANLS